MAKIDLIRQIRGPQTPSVYVRTTAVTSSLTGEYDLEFVPITGISASVDGPGISGSLSKAHLSSKVPNLISGSAQVKSLLPSGMISGSKPLTGTGVVSASSGVVNLPNTKVQYANVYSALGCLLYTSDAADE